MGVFELLSVKEDARKDSDLCFFNGYLEDYLNEVSDSDVHRDIFVQLFEADHALKIIVGLNISVLNETISNAIIRYKDITKYRNKALTIPYVIYGKKDDQEKAIVLTDEDYLYAKGLYYVLTEPGSEFRERTAARCGAWVLPV